VIDPRHSELELDTQEQILVDLVQTAKKFGLTRDSFFLDFLTDLVRKADGQYAIIEANISQLEKQILVLKGRAGVYYEQRAALIKQLNGYLDSDVYEEEGEEPYVTTPPICDPRPRC